MDIERLDVVLRPRVAWEAMDLGFALVRRWWKTLWGTYALFVLPLSLALCFLMRNLGVWILLVLWWLKPLGDQVILHSISRAIFGSPPTARQMRGETPRLWWRHLIPSLFWDRFDTRRALMLPIRQLEGLKGADLRRRRRILMDRETAWNRGGSGATWLSISCFALEILVVFSLILLMLILIPEEYLPSMSDEGSWLSNLHPSRQGAWLGPLYALGTALVSPFFVCAGFALYLTRRTHLDGWDIELSFRRLAARHKSTGMRAASGLLVAFVLVGFVPRPAFAKDKEPAVSRSTSPSSSKLSPEKVQETAKKILAGEEFKTKQKVKKWVPNDPKKETESKLFNEMPQLGNFAKVIASGMKVILWGFFGVALLVGIYYLLSSLSVDARLAAKAKKRGTAHLHAADPGIKFDLPADPLAAAKNLWTDGRAAEALGMLYRSSLQELARDQRVKVPKGATEAECVAAVRAGAPEAVTYFRSVTHAWLAVAFAHRIPEPTQFETLCEAYHQQFRSAS